MPNNIQLVLVTIIVGVSLLVILSILRRHSQILDKLAKQRHITEKHVLNMIELHNKSRESKDISNHSQDQNAKS